MKGGVSTEEGPAPEKVERDRAPTPVPAPLFLNLCGDKEQGVWSEM